MDEEERKIHEEMIGFLSFGRASDEVYYPIITPIEENDEEFTPVQAMEYILMYPEYLELIYDEENDPVFITKYYSDPFRYVMNEDRIFKVADTFYRVFEEAVLGSVNIEQLYSITQSQIMTLLDDDEGNNVFVFSNRKSGGSNNSNSDDDNPAPVMMGNCNRISGCMSCKTVIVESPVASNNKEMVVGEFKYEYYKKGKYYRAHSKIYARWRGGQNGCWTSCKRTLNMDYHMEIFWDNSIANSYTKYKSSKPEYSREKEHFSLNSNVTNAANCSIYNLCGEFWIATTKCVF